MSFYEFLRSAPYVRLVLPFIIGILSGNLLKTSSGLLWCYLLIAAIFCFLVLNWWNQYKTRWLWGVLLHLFIAFAGFMVFSFSLHRPFFSEDEVVAKGTIVENPLEKSGNFSTILKLEFLNENGVWHSSDDKILLLLKKSSRPLPELGHNIIFKGHLKEIRNFGNPYEFDYKAYMNRAGIYYRAYVDSGDWAVAGLNSSFNIRLKALQWRNVILNYFRQLDMGPPAFAVISALTVGDRTYLDQELKSAYLNTGMIHVLAVSGMHVGLLFWLLQLITKPLMLWRRGKIARALLVLSVIWIYALITGLTPSVVRASVMFSFWMLGETGNRKVSIYNTISASALFLLVLNPQSLFDVGFQLSYMAVLGIVVFYKDIYNWVIFNNWFLKKGWGIVAVSLSAQLLTLPLTLFYFHQFPNYFILSNIIALPLASAILYTSIAALAIAPLKFLWLPVGWILKWLVFAMNWILMRIEHLPGSVTTEINITLMMALSVFVIVVAVRIFIFNRKAVFVYVILISCIVFSGNILVRRMKVNKSSEMIVLNTSGPLVILLRNGLKCYVLTNDTTRNVDKFVKPFKEALMLKPPLRVLIGPHMEHSCSDFSFYKGFLMFKGKKVYVWEQNPGFDRKAEVDLLVLVRIRQKDAQEIQKYFSASTILIKSDVFIPLANRIKSDFSAMKQPCELLNAHGSWALSLPKKNDK